MMRRATPLAPAIFAAALASGCFSSHVATEPRIEGGVRYADGEPASGIPVHLSVDVYGQGSLFIEHSPHHPDGCHSPAGQLTGHYVFSLRSDRNGAFSLSPRAQDAAWETDLCNWVGRVAGDFSPGAPADAGIAVHFTSLRWGFVALRTPATAQTCGHVCATEDDPGACEDDCFRDGEVLRSQRLSEESLGRALREGVLEVSFTL